MPINDNNINTLHKYFDALKRPAIIGEYPYYRASPRSWKTNLTTLKENGIDIISFYIPWRFHEICNSENIFEFDFNGSTNPQKNLYYLLNIISELNLKVLIKPGPFIHAEVQLGGLPDRICNNLEFNSYIGLNQQHHLSQGQKLPSFFDCQFKKEVSIWLNNMALQIIRPFAAPSGPIVAIQLGNEGIYSDANFNQHRSDASLPSLMQFYKCYTQATQSNQSLKLPNYWIQWHIKSLIAHWDWLKSFYPEDTTKVINLPLASIASNNTDIANWLFNLSFLQNSNYITGHTEWIGNASESQQIFMAHIIEITALKSSAIESNWGLGCYNPSFAKPEVTLFHAILNLMLGSKTCSIYTACATKNWHSSINLDTQSLLVEGLNPKLYSPPYCPGAPFAEDGRCNPNAKSLQILKDLIHQYGSVFINSELSTDATLHFSEEFLYECILSKSTNILFTIFKIIKSLLFEHSIVLIIQSQPEIRSTDHFNFTQVHDLENFVKFSKHLISKNTHGAISYKSRNKTTAILHRKDSKNNLTITAMFNPGKKNDQITITKTINKKYITISGGKFMLHIYKNNHLEFSL